MFSEQDTKEARKHWAFNERADILELQSQLNAGLISAFEHAAKVYALGLEAGLAPD